MSFGFLACAGPEHEVSGVAARISETPALLPCASAHGFRLWAAPGTPVLVSGDRLTAAIGIVLDRPHGHPLTALGHDLRLDAGFAARHWGAYLLVQRQADLSLRLLRDPSGTVPAFHCRQGELTLAASGPETMRAVGGGLPWRADLHVLRHWLTFPFLRTSRTGIKGINELLPGTAVSGSGEPEVVWSPWTHTGPRQHPDFDGAARALRAALLDCVPALVPAGEQVVLQLSGGLDSSIIAAALGHARRDIIAVTFATRAADGDERAYARAVADHLGIGLIELVEDDTATDFRTLPAPAFRPPPTALLQPYRRLVGRQLAELDARWTVNGAGGDNLFASLNSAGPVLDALRLGGPRAAGTAAADIATIHNASFWHVLRLAARKAGRRPRAWPRETRFLQPSAVLPDIDAHPWLPAPSGALPGKREHVQSLIGIQHFLDQDRAGPNGLFPLLSQPLLELCLSIPTHVWAAGGRDRAVARAAVRGLLPDRVLDRRGKGRLESLFMTGYMQGRSQLEALLLDGRLRDHGIIDAGAMSAYLRQSGQPRDSGYTRLLELAAAENWLRSLPG